MTGESFGGRWNALTAAPEHQRKRLYARTRARYMLLVGLPLGMLAFVPGIAFGLSKLYTAMACYLIAVVVGWVIGTQAANRKLSRQ
jgi:hypothetical protein